MTVGRQENQLELFDLANQPVPRFHREAVGRLMLQARHDQVVVAGIIGLIGLTVVFACGVERGKQLVSGERAVLARQQPVVPQPATSGGKGRAPAATESGPATPAAKADETERAPTPALSPFTPKATQPRKLVVGTSRYAVQVVTFSRPQLASQELQRLKARGEMAFLILRDGRTSVYVGPFPSKQHANKKLAMLKPRYQDCFVKSL